MPGPLIKSQPQTAIIAPLSSKAVGLISVWSRAEEPFKLNLYLGEAWHLSKARVA